MEYVNKQDLVKMGWSDSKLTPEMVADLNRTLERYEITNPERIKQFISQCSHESGLGKYTTEQGTKAYFEAQGYEEKNRGAGYLQVTGKENYKELARVVNDYKVVEQGADYVGAKYPWMASGIWWEQNHMNARIDSMMQKNMSPSAMVDEVSRVVNAGPEGKLSDVNGLEDRHLYYNRAVQNHIGEPKFDQNLRQFEEAKKQDEEARLKNGVKIKDPEYVPGRGSEKHPYVFGGTCSMSTNFKGEEAAEKLEGWQRDLNKNVSHINTQRLGNSIGR